MKASLPVQKIWIGVLMALITSLGLMATDVYTPAMPTMMQALATSSDKVQLTITVFLIAAGLSQLIYGPLSDHWGRRPVLISGLAVYVLGTALCIFANSIPLLLVGRFIQGIGTGGVMALNRVVIRDVFSGVQLIRALSYIGGFIALAPAVAPALGGFITVYGGWRWVFGFLLIYSIVLAILAWFTLPETHETRTVLPPSLRRVMQNYGVIIRNRHFLANVGCAGLALAIMITCATVNPFILENSLGKSAAEYGFYAMLSASGFFLGMMANTTIVRRLGTEQTVKMGNIIIALMALSFIITGYLHIVTVTAIILPTIGIELGIALVFPNAFVGAIAPFPTAAGATAALYGCLQVGISFAASIVVALMNEFNQLPMGILLLCSALTALMIYQRLNQPLEPVLILAIAAQDKGSEADGDDRKAE